MRFTVELDDPEYLRLKFEAERRGLGPEQLASEMLRGRLPTDRLTEEQIRRGLEALEWFREFGKTLPQTDISAILEESRAELEERPYL